MLLMNSIETVKKFVKESTSHFDSSHGYDHAIAVYNNAQTILNHDVCIGSYKLGFSDFTFVTLTLALIHDVIDHKYPESISKDSLKEFLNNVYPIYTDILLELVDNISWSKQDKGLTKQFDEPYNIILTIVRDADRLEAIGKIGVERCIEFSMAKGLGMDNVIKHFDDKLLRIYPEKFIETEKGRKMAKPLHDYMVGWLDGYKSR